MKWRRYHHHHQPPPPSFLSYLPRQCNYSDNLHSTVYRIHRVVSPLSLVKMTITLMFALLQHSDVPAVLNLAADAKMCLDNANIFQCLIYFVLVETTIYNENNRHSVQTSWTTVNLSWEDKYLVFLNLKLYIFRISKLLFDENSKVLN